MKILNTADTTENRAEAQAASQYSSICEMVANLDLEPAIEHFVSMLSDAEAMAALTTCREYNEEDAPSALLLPDEIRQQLIDAMNDGFEPKGFEFDEEQARETIQEDALSVEVRSGWHSPGDKVYMEEFCILLCTGGPAARIRGELDEHNEPTRAWLEYQDWGTPWTEYHEADQDTLLAYCRQFYFGE